MKNDIIAWCLVTLISVIVIYVYITKILIEYLERDIPTLFDRISEETLRHTVIPCWTQYRDNWSLSPKFQLKLYLYILAFEKFSRTGELSDKILRF